MLQIALHDGTIISGSTESYNAEEMTLKLNDTKLFAGTIGDIVFNKNMLKYIAPTDSPTVGREIDITLHDGTTLKAYDDNYNSNELSLKLNDHKLLLVSVGDVIFNRNMMAKIVPSEVA